MATKSIQRSLKLIKEYGWHFWITEHWNQYSRRREDLYGFCDILCMDGIRTIAIQACGADLASHREKLRENEYVLPWLESREIQIWSWRKLVVKRGMKARRWNCKKTDVLEHDGAIYFEER